MAERVWRTVIAAAALAAAAAGTAAQDPASAWSITDQRAVETRNGVRFSPGDANRASLAAYAACMLDRHRAPSEAALAMPEREALVALSKMTDNWCASRGSLRMPLPVLRGAMFAARYRRDYAQAAPRLPASAPDLSVGLADDQTRSTSLLLRRVADCLWRADPQDARNALTKVVGGPAEQAAFEGLQKQLQPCSPARPIRFSKVVLGGLLAEVALIEANASG